MIAQKQNREGPMVVLFFIAWGLVFMDRLAISYLMPVIQKEIDVNNTEVGLIGFVTATCFAAGTIIFGIISDKIGYKKRLIVPFLIGTAVFSALGAFTTTLPQLIVVRSFVGICEGPLATLLFSAMSMISRKETFGRNCGIMNSGVGALGVIVGPLFITQLLVFVDWHMAFFISAIPTVIIALVIKGYMKEIKTKSAKEIKAETAEASKAVDANTGETVIPQDVKLLDLFKYRNVSISCILTVIMMCAYWSMMLFAPLYLTQITGFSVQTMGWVTSLMGVLYIVYCIIIPKLSDNFGRKPVIAVGLVICMIAPLSMFFFQGSIFAAVLYVAFGGMLAATNPLYQNIIPLESIPYRFRATANAFVLAAGDFLGAACWQVVAGVIGDRAGIPFMMLISAFILAAGVIISRALFESNPKKWALPYKINEDGEQIGPTK